MTTMTKASSLCERLRRRGEAIADAAQREHRTIIVPKPAVVREYWAAFDSALEAAGYDTKGNPENRMVLRDWCARYALQAEDRGLLVLGHAGRGKSFGLRIVGELLGIKIVHACDLAEAYRQADDYTEYWRNLNGLPADVPGRPRDLIVDDIMAEPVLNAFGTRTELMTQVIEHRSRVYDRYRALTVFASNHPLEPVEGTRLQSIAERYGERSVSRLLDMCRVVAFKGPDRRRTQS